MTSPTRSHAVRALTIGLAGASIISIPTVARAAITATEPSALAATVPIQRTVTVSGRVVVRVDPDRAEIRLSSVHAADTAARARSVNAANTKKLIAAIRAANVPAAEISSGLGSVKRTVHDDSRGRLVKERFTARTEVVVRLTDVRLAADVVSVAFDKGASEGTVEFSTSKLRQYRDQARREAIKAAREKATLMADASGVALGKVVGFHEVSDRWYWPSGQVNAVQNVSSAADGSGAVLGDDFGAGPISVEAEISIEVLLL